ncbi:hypothetical protein B0H19DRAFT_442610 [Mycena capillaripes]|nr:hypothetical protein B0H19DRAFT_442610 [Mycena capillaripes]
MGQPGVDAAECAGDDVACYSESASAAEAAGERSRWGMGRPRPLRYRRRYWRARWLQIWWGEWRVGGTGLGWDRTGSSTPMSRRSWLAGLGAMSRGARGREMEPVWGATSRRGRKKSAGWSSHLTSRRHPNETTLDRSALLGPMHTTLETAASASASNNNALQPTSTAAGDDSKRASQIVYTPGFVNRLVNLRSPARARGRPLRIVLHKPLSDRAAIHARSVRGGR